MYKNYKNKVSKYQNKLNQIGGAQQSNEELDKLMIILLNTNTLGTMPLPSIINLYRTGHPGIQNAIKEYKMHDFYDQTPLQDDVSLLEFNQMFPFCRGLNISHRTNDTDADFVYLRGIKKLSIVLR